MKRIFKNIDMHDFSLYLFFSILVIVLMIAIGKFNITQARYESNVTADVTPTLAFFLVDVTTETGQIRLDGIIPNGDENEFEFEVSNFNATEHADVDLTYTIEIITTTNIPLDFKIFKGADRTHDEIDDEILTTDDNGVFYRHLMIYDVSTMSFASDVTDRYTLQVIFPTTYMDFPDDYEGIIELVDVKISAEQVV